ncbi:hypothetical protein AALO_G00145790 [Alosa alosa]|uniref:Uncharacterized protein n=1 Tax=Alosa alosa TaxID=278164 RepID=A0AAV6GJL8_9TELE|nr:hypothetical protein AALO_G00145790 [Alosa alosa]
MTLTSLPAESGSDHISSHCLENKFECKTAKVIFAGGSSRPAFSSGPLSQEPEVRSFPSWHQRLERRPAGSVPMSARNGSASDADCQISEDCRIPADVELMELGPLLEQAAQPGGAKALAAEVWEGRWRVIPFHVLPEWLKDNDYLLHGHRPPMPSFQGPPLRSQVCNIGTCRVLGSYSSKFTHRNR